MKNKINILAKIMLVVCASTIFNSHFSILNFQSLQAQNFATTDTVTEHPHKGTYYHDKFVGRKTASGEVFDQNKFTAAHWRIKLGTMVMVTNRNTGLQVIVKVNDRCPKHGVFDMTHRAAAAIGIRGSQPVTIRILPQGYEKRWMAQDALFDSVTTKKSVPKPAVADSSAQQAVPELVAENVKPVAEQPKPEAEKVKPAVEKPRPAAVQKQKHHDGLYDIALGIAPSHGDAFLEIQKLPKIYQDKVLVEQLDESDEVKLTLNVRLHRAKATDLQRALQHTFPDAKVVPAEE